MPKVRFFHGNGMYTRFAQIAYQKMVSGEWFTYADIMSEYTGGQVGDGISYCDNYGELKKAVSDLQRVINERAGMECFERSGNKRDLRLRYMGTDNDPLIDMRHASTIDNLRRYYDFCQDSAGFFPTSWLEHFLEGSVDLLNIKTKRHKGEQIVNASMDRELKNIDYLPLLYDQIKEQRVITFNYLPFDEPLLTMVFHPHCLKEYNGRWYLYGLAEDRDPAMIHVAIDRMASRPKICPRKNYIPADKGYYQHLFEHMVGVTHLSGHEPEWVCLRVHTKYMSRLIETKPFHPTQTTKEPFGVYEDGEYAEFMLHVEVNNELKGRFRQLGADLEVMAPECLRNEMQTELDEMLSRYRKNG